MTTEQPHPSVREVLIGDEQAGQRIDNFLLTQLKGVPKSRVYRILRRGEVRVNRGRIKPTYRLASGDRVRIPPVRTDQTAAPGVPNDRVLGRIADAILYEDSRFLILNKPSGLAVHGGSGLQFGAIEALRALRPSAPFLELAHRLDRETSGCLVIAKRRSALRAFHELLRNGDVDKRYLALVRGRWQEGRHAVDAPLKKNQLSSGERMVRVAPDGKAALTIFEPAAIYSNASLLQVDLRTGRTHQVRVHAAHAGHPLAGDGKYGDPAFNREMAAYGLKRLFLHAVSVEFSLPEERGGQVSVTAPLAPELRQVIDRLEAGT